MASLSQQRQDAADVQLRELAYALCAAWPSAHSVTVQDDVMPHGRWFRATHSKREGFDYVVTESEAQRIVHG